VGSFRYLTAGESHGEELLGILEGVPAALSLIAARDIDPWLAERQKGYGRSRRQQIEQDTATIVSGVRFGVTTGGPIGIKIRNKDWVNWGERMSVTPIEQSDPRPVTVPRPGHADLPGGIKYAHTGDLRNVLERASARETAMRVAIGAIASKLLLECGIESVGFVESIGSIACEVADVDPFTYKQQIANSPLRTFDLLAESRMIALIDEAKSNGDTLGGIVSCAVRGMPVGIGSYVHWDRKLDGLLAQSVMSIQAVKGVEIGDGFTSARSFGSEAHDEILREGDKLLRATNRAGGIEGGMSNGEPIIVRAAMKPISTLMHPLRSVDLATGEAMLAHIERSDVCAVPSLSVIVRAIVSTTVATALLDTFGGDTIEELKSRVEVRRSSSRLTTQIRKS
jgi:chorismate synthase